jgi:hypothetical protein
MGTGLFVLVNTTLGLCSDCIPPAASYVALLIQQESVAASRIAYKKTVRKWTQDREISGTTKVRTEYLRTQITFNI